MFYFPRDSFIQGALVVPIPNIALDPFKVCFYDHNQTLGVTFELSIIVFGMSPIHEIRTMPTTLITDTIALVSMVAEVSKYTKHFALSAMLRAVVSDVTVHFFTIFLSHLLLVVTLETARVRFWCTPLCWRLQMIRTNFSRV